MLFFDRMMVFTVFNQVVRGLLFFIYPKKIFVNLYICTLGVILVCFFLQTLQNMMENYFPLNF